MADGDLPRPAQDVVFRELNGQTVLVHLGRDQIYALNATGSRFWQLLANTSNRSSIRSALLREFDVEPEALDAEIDRLVGELRVAGLVA